MSLAGQILKDRNLRCKLSAIVQEECAKLKVKPENVYNIFEGARNTGEQIMLPEVNSAAFENITARFAHECKLNVTFSHRNLYI